MNRIWISRNSSIPVREQLSAQILYGILSRRIGPAERLPSVRDLARRLKVHPNTVSAAYRDLAARGWVKAKTGSGVFVREIEHRGKADGIDAFVEAWVQEGLGRGFSLEALAAALEKIGRESGRPEPLLVIHPTATWLVSWRRRSPELSDAPFLSPVWKTRRLGSRRFAF